MKKIYLALILGLFLFSFAFVSAEPLIFEKNTTITLKNFCQEGGCTGITLTSITYPDGKVSHINQAMVFRNQTGYYNFSGTTSLGTYNYCTLGSNGITNCAPFKITPDGKDFSLTNSIMYSLFLLLFVGLLVLMVYLSFSIEGDNPKDEEGNFMSINLKKHLKIIIIGLIYPIFLIILNLMNAIALNLIGIDQFTGTISFLFSTLLSLSWVWTVIIFIWIIYHTWKDSEIKKAIKENFYY